MNNSAATCRAQEAHHLKIAEASELANVRNIALAAATAWGHEAVWAEKRESGSVNRLSAADAEIAREFQEDADEIDDGPEPDRAALSAQDGTGA
ncbi:hypothetical protein [Sphingobium boeckii]|uniref:Transcriptional regulator of nitric oxide reductase n=1 Tax=Sphingobium boeckii TaxID=1082345 RepID=A0A7W9AIP8_9SPHN|nr:hypothetical protein [Sphingobium boeckii]MBB5686393.1 transcriptional regulator of nitric oxide reductase [Sphingobium boeckii]